MSPIKPGQVSFAGGEGSPFIYSRIDLAKYSTFLKTCKNFFIHPHGGASNRGGFRKVRPARYTDKISRVVDYIFAEDEAYTLEFGDQYVRFYTDNDPVLEAAKTITAATQANPCVITSAAHGYSNGDDVEISGIEGMTELNGYRFRIANKTNDTYELEGIDSTGYTAYTTGGGSARVYTVATPYLEADIRSLKLTSSADVIYITHRGYKTKTLTRYAETTWTLADYTHTGGPFLAENIDDAHTMAVSALSGAGITLTSSVSFFTADHIGALIKLKHYMEGNSRTENFSSAAAGTAISCFATWRVISHGTWTGKFQVQKSTDGGSTWTMLREFSSAADYNANTYGTEEDSDPFLVRVECTAYTSGTINVDISSDPFYQDGIGLITARTSATVVTVTAQSNFGSTDPTNAWSEGAWSDERGYPSDSVFLEERLVFNSCPYEPMTIHMSETGNYSSFKRSIDLVDTDGISINLRSRQLNAINGLVALQSLLAFTSSSEWLVGAKDDIYTPTTTFRKPQGYRGSVGLAPIIVGDTVIYIQSNGRIIRSFTYSFEKDGYVGDDLRIMAEHLFSGHTIVDFCYQQDNESIVWLVRDDGLLISMTIMLEQEVIAFAQHDTQGTVESVCSIPAGGFDELWITVNRENGRFVERMAERVQSEDVMDNVILDSFVAYNDGPKTEFLFLDHLEGQEVRAIADGIVYPAQTVTDGKITLPDERTHVYIGLQYNSDLETMDIARSDKRGMVKGRPVKVGQVTFQVLNSRGGFIGPTFDDLYEAFIPERDSTDEAPELQSGDFTFPLGGEYSDGGRVCYRQSDPLPVTITAVVPEVAA